jgi:AcrR family transcriptional regulator
MPKVSDAHRAARRRQVLDAAARCFLRDGFHATSMQDVFDESGLSAGAVYRYFPSKTAIVAAIAEEKVGRIIDSIDQIAETDPPLPLDALLDRVLAVVDAYTGPNDDGRIAIQVWGESMRDPALAVLVAGIYRRIRSKFAAIAAQAQTQGHLPTQAEAEDLGAALFGLVQGYMLQRLLLRDPTAAERYRRAVAFLFAEGAPSPTSP